MTLHVTEKFIQGKPISIKEDFEQRANRDKRVKELKELGYKVRKSSTRSQVMHPKNIKDYSGEGKDNNFTGPYRTYFAVIYSVEATKGVKLFGYE